LTVLSLAPSKEAGPAKPEDLSLRILVPAFMISELKHAFEIGFLLFLPFLIIDLVDDHDDAAAGRGIAAVQIDLFCSRGRLEPGRWLADL